jgi:LacI family transcriptional regulator, gluconate utilization system Gnt-I transcriptional repressor
LPFEGNGPRTRPVRVEDVARVAGVSPITVSRALSQPEKVREETRQRVIAAVAETGYVVNSLASGLRSGRSNIVTVFVSNLENRHFAATMQGIIDAFEGSRFRLMFSQTGYSEMLEADLVDAILPFRPAGVIFTDVVRSEKSRVALQSMGVPVMEMWGQRPDPIDMLVGFSNADAAALMGDHLGREKRRHVAYCGHVSGRGGERIDGLRKALAVHGAELGHIEPVDDAAHVSDGIAAFDRIIAAYPACDAIFFGTDVMAVGALLRARQQHIDVPGKIAVAGFGDLDFAAHVEPPLTSLHIDGREMGLEAGRRLLRRLNGGTVSDPVMMRSAQLVARASTVA